MRTNIIEDLRFYYLKHSNTVEQLLSNKKMKKVCDGYFIQGLSYHAIASSSNLSVSEVRKLLIRACGRIIRNRN